MKAAVLTAVRAPLEVWDIEPTPLRPTEARVRIDASGVCRSDHHRVTGSIPTALPVVLGHEACGTVLEVGPLVTRVKVGDRVVATANPECGHCWYCANGQPNLCVTMAQMRARPAGVAPDGSEIAAMAGLGTFRESMAVDQTMLVAVQTRLPAEQLALLGCGVMTGVGAVLNTAEVSPGCSVAIIGCGGVGLACVQGSRIAAAARIFAIDPVPSKRQAALALGATDALDPAGEDVAAAVRSATGGRGADYVFEVVGSAATIVQARALTRRGGTTVLVGAAASAEQVTFSAWDLHTEGRLLGCSNGSAHVQRDVPRLIAFAEAGLLDLGSLVSRTIALSELDEAFRAMEAGEVIRSVVV